MALSATATQLAAIAANANAVIKAFIALPHNSLEPAPFSREPGQLFGWDGMRRAIGRRACLLLLFLYPERVMLLGPVQIDLAGAHPIKSAFHADRADIDVRQHRGDE